jgi:hypothetical protein
VEQVALIGHSPPSVKVNTSLSAKEIFIWGLVLSVPGPGYAANVVEVREYVPRAPVLSPSQGLHPRPQSTEVSLTLSPCWEHLIPGPK